MKKILFLYTELAGYFEACVKELDNRDVEIHIVRWPVNQEAPFKFSFPQDVKIYDRSDYNTGQLFELLYSILPDTIIASGWVDKGYVKVCRKFRDNIPVVLTMDNQWHGNLRQQVARLLSPFTLHRNFNKVWVPGIPQKKYALKLGFKSDVIETGFYSADVNRFDKIAEVRLKKDKLPKRFLYIGRYIPQKGIDKLFSAFMELQDEGYDEWELWCMGKGELYDKRPLHDNIKHFGFVQPGEMEKYLEDAGVFVLPSDFEPWGVVVHEMATAAFPMIVSSAVGSISAFINDSVSGYVFTKGNQEELKSAMKKIMELSDDELKNMAKASHEKGLSWTPREWADIVEGLLAY